MKNKSLIFIIAISVLTIGLIITYFVIRRRKARMKPVFKEDGTLDTEQTNFSSAGAKEALQEIKQVYGKKTACIVEKMFRLESGHFKANIFRKTGGAGMTAPSEEFPYGWGGMKNFWQQNQDMAPVGTTGKLSNGFNYIVFPSLKAGMFALAERLQQIGLNPGAWFSTDPSQQASYNAKVAGITSQYITGCNLVDELGGGGYEDGDIGYEGESWANLFF